MFFRSCQRTYTLSSHRCSEHASRGRSTAAAPGHTVSALCVPHCLPGRRSRIRQEPWPGGRSAASWRHCARDSPSVGTAAVISVVLRLLAMFKPPMNPLDISASQPTPPSQHRHNLPLHRRHSGVTTYRHIVVRPNRGRRTLETAGVTTVRHKTRTGEEIAEGEAEIPVKREMRSADRSILQPIRADALSATNPAFGSGDPPRRSAIIADWPSSFRCRARSGTPPERYRRSGRPMATHPAVGPGPSDQNPPPSLRLGLG